MHLPLRIKTRRIEPDIIVVEFGGKVTMTAECRRMEGVIQELLQNNERKFIFDMSGVEYVDSSGMGSIATCLAAVMRAQGGFRVAGLNDRLRGLFKITRMDTVLSFYSTVEAACEGFTATSSPDR